MYSHLHSIQRNWSSSCQGFCKNGTAHSTTWKPLLSYLNSTISKKNRPTFFGSGDLLIFSAISCTFRHFFATFQGSLLKEHRASVEARAGPRLKLLFFCLEAQNRCVFSVDLGISSTKKSLKKWRGRWEQKKNWRFFNQIDCPQMWPREKLRGRPAVWSP